MKNSYNKTKTEQQSYDENIWAVEDRYLTAEVSDSEGGYEVAESFELDKAKKDYIEYCFDGRELSDDEKISVIRAFDGDISVEDVLVREVLGRTDLSKYSWDEQVQGTVNDYMTGFSDLDALADNDELREFIVSTIGDVRHSFELSSDAIRESGIARDISRGAFDSFCEDLTVRDFRLDVLESSTSEYFENLCFKNLRECYDELSDSDKGQLINKIYTSLDHEINDTSHGAISGSIGYGMSRFMECFGVGLSDIFTIDKLSSESTLLRLFETVSAAICEEKEITFLEEEHLAELIRDRADDFIFRKSSDVVIPRSEWTIEINKGDLVGRTLSLFSEDFLDKNNDLEFWMGRSSDDVVECAQKYMEINDKFGRDGNIVPTEDFVRYYIYSGRPKNAELYKFCTSVDLDGGKYEDSNIPNFDKVFPEADLFDVMLVAENKAMLLNIIEHGEFFEDIFKNNDIYDAKIKKLLLDANLYDPNNKRCIESIASFDESLIISAMHIFNRDPNLYSEKEGVIMDIAKNPNAERIMSIVSSSEFGIVDEAIEVYDGIEPGSRSSEAIKRLFSHTKSFELYKDNADLVDRMNDCSNRRVYDFLIESMIVDSDAIRERFDEVLSLDKNKNISSLIEVARDNISLAIDIADRFNDLDPITARVAVDIYKDTKKIDVDKIEEVFQATKGMYSDIVDHQDALSKNIIHSILDMEEGYIETLEKIDKIFSTSDIPEFVKRFSIFKTFFPDAKKEDIKRGAVRSPTLKSAPRFAEAILFNDMLKISIDSNDPSTRRFLNGIKDGQGVLDRIENGELSFSDLDKKQSSHLERMFNSLDVAYKISKKGAGRPISQSNHLEEEYKNLCKYYRSDKNHSLSNNIIRWFTSLSYGGRMKSTEDVLLEMSGRNRYFDAKNRENAKSGKIKVKKGDFIKGIGHSEGYVTQSIEKGIVCKEMLGAGDDITDMTPLDTDLSRIQEDGVTDNLAARGYGPYYVYIKDSEIDTSQKSTFRNVDSVEAFSIDAPGGDHWGIRTGLGSGYIDAIMTDEKHNHIIPSILKRGIYIPITDMSGEVKFTPEQYDKLREKMRGMSYYGEDLEKPVISHYSNERIEKIKAKKRQDAERISRQKEIIERAVIEAIQQDANIKEFDGNIDGGVEVIDTGSTGRGTNLPGDGDYDYMIRVDRTIINDSSKLNAIKQHIHRAVGGVNEGGEHLRIKGASINGESFDFDATFAKMNISLQYSTDMAISERLNNIKKYNPEEYENVIANIVAAKQILKEAGAYKKGTHGQGGLGGVGVENWILQNNGSLEVAAREFLESAKGRNFDEFKDVYKIYDFGQNHVAIERGQGIAYNEFVCDNMTPEGYEAMKSKLIEEFPEIWEEISSKK